MPSKAGSSGKSGMGNSIRAEGDVLEEVGTLGSRSASHVDGLALPMLPAHRTTSHLRIECRHPLREPLQFIVMSVMGGTFPDIYGFSA